jgi:hypothetical protein
MKVQDFKVSLLASVETDKELIRDPGEEAPGIDEPATNEPESGESEVA